MPTTPATPALKTVPPVMPKTFVLLAWQTLSKYHMENQKSYANPAPMFSMAAQLVSLALPVKVAALAS